VLLVHCDVTPEVARGRLFESLLVDNGIQWEYEKAKKDSDGYEALAKRAGRELQTRQLGQTADAESADPVELVYVEAGHNEIRSTLAALNARPEKFLAVSVKPAPGTAPQKGLSYFNRNGQAGAAAQTQEPVAQTASSAAGPGQAGNAPARSPQPGGHAQRVPLPGGEMRQTEVPEQSAAQSALADTEAQQRGDRKQSAEAPAAAPAQRPAPATGDSRSPAEEPPAPSDSAVVDSPTPRQNRDRVDGFTQGGGGQGRRAAAGQMPGRMSVGAQSVAQPNELKVERAPNTPPAGPSNLQEQGDRDTYRVLFVLRVVQPPGTSAGVAAGREVAAEGIAAEDAASAAEMPAASEPPADAVETAPAESP